MKRKSTLDDFIAIDPLLINKTSATKTSLTTDVANKVGAITRDHKLKLHYSKGGKAFKERVMMMKGVALAAYIKRVLEKLAATSVPTDALENARHFLESTVRDVTVAAHGLAKDALHRIKTHLVDVLPSLSPAVTRKMVYDAEKEASEEQESGGEHEEEARQDDHPLSGKSTFASPASSLFALIKPLSRL